jgi:hypothetical protein
MSKSTHPATPSGDGDQLPTAAREDQASPTAPAPTGSTESAARPPNPGCLKHGIHHRWDCPSMVPCPHISQPPN